MRDPSKPWSGTMLALTQVLRAYLERHGKSV
jgi:hypothetical protein